MGIEIFSDPKYNAPSQNALNFIKNQMANDLPRSYRIPSTKTLPILGQISLTAVIFTILVWLCLFLQQTKTFLIAKPS